MRRKGDCIELGVHRIAAGERTFIVAELSANHRQDISVAEELVHAAAEMGADAVKVQTYTPDTLTIDSSLPHFIIEGTAWSGRNLYDLYREAYMPWDWQPRLKEVAESLGLVFFSTPFDASAVEFLEEMDVLIYKIASFELVDVGLLRRVAATGKPVILSTGMATLEEIAEAVSVLWSGGAGGVALLKCVSAYPAPYREMNLRTIPNMAATFNVPCGLSDHTLGISVPVAAVSVGACIVEKHFTLSRASGGPDCHFSLEPLEFREMVQAVRQAEEALGEVSYKLTAAEEESRMFRRSLFVVESMEQGEEFTEENIRSIRPSLGLHPRYLPIVLGRKAARKIERGTPLTWDLVL